MPPKPVLTYRQELVWDGHHQTTDGQYLWAVHNLHPTTYNGQPHLACTILPYVSKPDYSYSQCFSNRGRRDLPIMPVGGNVLFNDKYEMVKVFDPPASSYLDDHEFELVDNGTVVWQHALASVTLSASERHRTGMDQLTNAILHVFNASSGATIFEWHSYDHVPFEEKCTPDQDEDYMSVRSEFTQEIVQA